MHLRNICSQILIKQMCEFAPTLLARANSVQIWCSKFAMHLLSLQTWVNPFFRPVTWDLNLFTLLIINIGHGNVKSQWRMVHCLYHKRPCAFTCEQWSIRSFNSSYISTLMDESTDITLSQKSIIYFKYIFKGRKNTSSLSNSGICNYAAAAIKRQ